MGPFGKFSLILYFATFIGLVVVRLIIHSKYVIICYSFYYIGSVIFGGGHVVIPLILQQFKNLDMITENEFWNGFAIVSALPGPLFNISAYVGVFAGGIIGALLSWGMLFLPSFLMIWGFLPYWNKYATNKIYQKIFQGLGATSVGFICSATILLWIQATNIDTVTCSFIVIITFTLYHIYHKPVPFVILIGGGLATARYFLLILYRGIAPSALKFYSTEA